MSSLACTKSMQTTAPTIQLATALVLGVVGVAGCALHAPGQVDPKSGQFQSFQPITPKEVKVYQPRAGIHEIQFVYLRTYATHDATLFDSVIRDGFKKIGFNRIVSTSELTQLVVRNDLANQVQDLSNPLALNRLAKAIGPFLVVDVAFVNTLGYRYRMDVKVLDAATIESLLLISREGAILVETDREFTYPMLNAVKGWFDDSVKLGPPNETPRTSGEET